MEGARCQSGGINWALLLSWLIYFTAIGKIIVLAAGGEKVEIFIIHYIKSGFPAVLATIALIGIGHLVKSRRLYYNKWTSYP